MPLFGWWHRKEKRPGGGGNSASPETQEEVTTRVPEYETVLMRVDAAIEKADQLQKEIEPPVRRCGC